MNDVHVQLTSDQEAAWGRRWLERYAEKLATPAEAVRRIPPGKRVFIASGAAEPACLVEALARHRERLSDREVPHLLTLRSLPVFVSEIPTLIRTRRLKVDVALIQVSPPDERGYVSLGVSVDVVRAALEAADLVIAQVNSHMPRTLGVSLLPVSEIDWLVPLDAPLFELRAEPPDAVTNEIGEHVANLIPDGATLQTGIGRIPNAILNALRSRHDLGVHTEVLSDGLMELAKAGAITGRRKTVRQGRMVTSSVIGSRELYEWVDQNPAVELHASDFSNDPLIIAKNSRMIAIGSGLSIDLTGQVAEGTLDGRCFSGIGGQVDFIRGAARSPGGKPIIALPATVDGGSASRIVSALEAGTCVATSRGDVHYVVTEYGVAQLWGKNIRERAAALVEIAHPDFRAELLNEAKARHFLLPDQPLPNARPTTPERHERLASGELLQIRALRAADEDKLQDLLYERSDESTFLRFFGQTLTPPQLEMLRLVEQDGATSLAFVACLVETDELVAAARCDLDPRSGSAELGMTVAEAWQDKGVGGLLLETLMAAATANGIRALTAEVLPTNRRMQRVLRRAEFRCSGEPGKGPLTFHRSLSMDEQYA